MQSGTAVRASGWIPVAAARQGARVAVIERYGFLGGNVAFSIMPCWHHLGDHHSGMLTQFSRQVEAFGVGPAPLKEGSHIEPEAVEILFLNMATDHRVQLYLHHFITGVVKEGNRIQAVITETAIQAGVRESRTIVGDSTLTVDDGAQKP